jgi:hypothetical protein
MTLVSSANIMDYDKIFIAGGRSFMYITKRKGSGTDPWGTQCFTVYQYEKRF